MKKALNNFLADIFFGLSIFISHLSAATVTVDLNITFNIQEDVVEANQPFTNIITISNLNSSGDNLSAAGAEVSYTLPSGTSYNSFSGSGWSCNNDSSTVTCTYNNDLYNGDTSNELQLLVNAPDQVTTLNPSVLVSLSGNSDPDTSNNSADDTVSTGKSNLHTSKTASKTPLQLNEDFQYTITVSNPENSSTTLPARNITLNDTLPDEISFVSFDSIPTGWSCNESSKTITCNGLNLDVDESKSLIINVKAPATSNERDITNSASITADSSDFNSLPLTETATVVVEAADIKITKELLNGINSNNAVVNSNVTYRITVINTGASPATDISISDTLPSRVSYQSIDDYGNWSCSESSSTVSCDLNDDNLTQNESYYVDINVKMPATHQDITNSATVSTSTGESDTTNNEATLLTHVKGADLNIEKTPDWDTTDIGSNYTYTISIENNGYATAENIVVTDTLDDKMTYVSDTGGCSQSGQTLTCNISDLDYGESTSFEVTVTMPSDTLDDVTNSVSISTSTDQENSNNTADTATTHLRGPNLNITKDANVSQIGLSKPFTYTLYIENINSADATDANITDQLPSGVNITDILQNDDGWNCPNVPISGTFHCTKSTFPGNSDSTIVFKATAPSATTGNIQNIATISHSLNSNDGSDDAVVNVQGVVLDIDKTASPTATVGGLIDYNITVTNNSLSDTQNLTLWDDINSQLGNGYTINQIIDDGGWDCSGSNSYRLSCTKSSLASQGESTTIHFNVNVPNNATLGNVTNTVNVHTDTEPQPTESDSTTTTIEGADIRVIAPSTNTAIANETVTFTIEVRNDGSATAKDVNITNYFNTNNTADFTDIKIDCDGDGTYDINSAPYTCELGDIAAQSSKNIIIRTTAPNYDSNFPGNSSINNESVATTTTSQSNENNNNVDWSVEIHGADLVVNKSSDKTEVALGGIVTYTLNIKNQWEANATNISLSDTTLGNSGDRFTFISGTLNYNSNDWDCTLDTENSFSCTYKHNLLQNQTTSDITIQAQAPNTLDAIDNIRDNKATVTNDTAERETATTNEKLVSVSIRGTDLGITKTVSPNPAKLNESVTYTITITNNGLADANNTYANDTLPDGFTNISTSGCNNDGSSVSGQSVHCTLGDLAQGDSKTFTITTNAPNTNGTYTNNASTNSNTLEKATDNNHDSVDLEVRGANLNVDKWDSADPVATNSTYYYYIGIRNQGFSSAYGAEINDTLPTSGYRFTYVGPLEVQNSDWECSINSNIIHCNTKNSDFEIPPGYNSGAIVKFKVQAPSTVGIVSNTAIVDTNTSESELNNNAEIEYTQVINIDLAARKLINGYDYGANENYIGINKNITYTLQVRNVPISGTTPPGITDVNVTDILPDNITNISVTPTSRFTCNSPANPGETLFCTMNDKETYPLEVSDGWVEVATIDATTFDASQFDVNDEDNNFIINRYKAQTSFGDQNPANNAPTTGDGYLHTNTLVRGTNLSIVKDVQDTQVNANQLFSYTLSIKNWHRNYTGNERDLPSTTAENIVVKDNLPANVSFINAEGTDWSCTQDTGVVTCTYNNTLSVNSSTPDITVNVTAPNSHGELLTNEANVTNTVPELTRLLNDNSDSVDVTTLGSDITITKTGPTEAGMADQITYNITVSNSTSTPASEIYLLDTLPNGATYDGDISDSHWSYAGEINGSIKFVYDQNLSGNSQTTFTFKSTLPNYTGTARNHIEAFTSTAEVSSPNQTDWDTEIKGADLVFASNITQSPNPVGAYGNHQYFITVRNQGLSPAKDINVTFFYTNPSIDSNWTNITGSGTGWNCESYNPALSSITCILSILDTSSNANVLTLSSNAPNFNSDITNLAVLRGKDDENTTTGKNKEVVTTVNGSDIKITKYAKDPDPQSDGNYHDDNITVGVGKPVDFKFSIKNDNLGLAKEITLTDTFPDGFSDFNITDQGDWSCSFTTNKLTCNRTELLPNTTAPDILVSAKTSGNISTVTNTADINTSTMESDSTNNQNSVDIKLEGTTLNIDLNASKTEVAMDEIYTYTLHIINTGRNDGIDINITDILNDDLRFVDFNGSDSGWDCNNSGNNIICTQPYIPAYNGESNLKLNIKAPHNKIGIYHNSIHIDSNSIENSIDVNAPDVRVIGADLYVDINATPKDVLEDRNVTYVLHVKDINISTAYDIHIGQTFSYSVNALYILDDGGADCNITDSNQSIECSIASLSYNEDINITIVATMPNTDTILDPFTSNIAVSTISQQGNTDNDFASIDTTVHPIIPVANYRFEECKWNGTNGEVIDSINGLNGKAKNQADTINHRLAKDNTNFSPIWRVGVFDGVNDRVKISSNSKLQISGNQTICFWVKPNNFNHTQKIITKHYKKEFYINLITNKKLRYYYGNRSSYNYINSDIIPEDKWTQACIVRNLDTKKLNWYINGINTNTKIMSILNIKTGNNAIKLGDDLDGNLDEVEIYNIALDERAIKDIYNYEKAGKNYDGSTRLETMCGVDLSIKKTSTPLGDVGAESPLSYTITIKNNSDEPVTKGFSVHDLLPSGVEYVSEGHSSNLTCNGTNEINCTFPDTVIMYKNDTETINIDVKTANLDKENITNSATVSSIQPDSITSNNTDSATNRIIGTDLKITKTATPTFPNANEPFIYTVRIENISSLANARDITMMDKFDNRLIYNGVTIASNEANASISCALPNADNTIVCDINRLSMGNYVEFNITMKSPTVATALINEANVTSITKDTYLPNNSVSISIDTNSSVNGANIDDLYEKYFNKDVSVNKYGNIATIGNTILVAPSITDGTKLNAVDSVFANSLGNGYTNSSSAILDIIDTNNSNSEDNITIEYAGLYWGGHIHGNEKNETGYNIPFNQIKFITPDGVVHNIIADKTDLNASSTAPTRVGYYHFKKGDEDNTSSNIGNFRIFYGAKVNITDIIRELNTNNHLEGTYSVADMNVTSGNDIADWAPTSGGDWERFRDYGYFGGWSMVVVYSVNHRYHRSVKFKNLSSFSGFRVMTPKSPGSTIELPIAIDGFITPIHGDIESSMFTFIQGGDRELTLEGMTVKDKDGTENHVIEDLNNTDNVFNDTITLKNSSYQDISKLPDESYNVGTDIDQYNLNSQYDENDNCINNDGRPCYLSNQQDETEVTISVSQSSTLDGTEYPSEQAFAQMMSMATQIFAPDFIDSYKECFKLKEPLNPNNGWVPCSDPLPLLRRGDKVKYRITAINTGDDYAKDIFITDKLPKQVTYDINSTVVTYLKSFDELETNSPCSSSLYEYDENIRNECTLHLKDLVDENSTYPAYTLPDGVTDGNITEEDWVNHDYDGTSFVDGNSTLVFAFDNFPKNHVIWIEFNTTINSYAALGETFENSISITFTNPTLDAFGYSDSTVTQVSLPVESSPVHFNWDNITIVARDRGRSTIGTKIANEPFDLNITLSGISSLDQNANTTIKLDSLKIKDIYNSLTTDIYSSVVDSNKTLADINNISWLTQNTIYSKASKELGFELTLSVIDGNYTSTKTYPDDFNSDPYAGDVFSTRPKSFAITLNGATVSGAYSIVNAGSTNLGMNITAPDFNGANSQNYNATLTKNSGSININLDPAFSTNPACININDLNINDLNFINGSTTSSNIKYAEVGIVKFVLKDSNWTMVDSLTGDCNMTAGDNNSSDGLVSCSIDGNSTSIVFKPDHFSFTNTTVNNGGNGFTYMVENPVDDPMFATISTTVESRNADDNITLFFSNSCSFSDNVNIFITYDASSKNLNDLNISFANDTNLSNINSNTNIASTNTDSSVAYGNNFTNGISPVTIRVAVDRNQTTPLQPLLVDAKDLNGSINSYLGIANADVNPNSTTDISATNDLHFLYGRVHAPDYRFAGEKGKAIIYYEAYCKDCNQSYRNNMGILGGESLDSINWYINTNHDSLNDGNVTTYSSVNNVKFGNDYATATDTISSTNVNNGEETLNVVINELPYIDKIEINASNWVTFDPKNFLLEFQDDGEDWAGQGKLGHIIDTNVSKRSNRRLDW